MLPSASLLPPALSLGQNSENLILVGIVEAAAFLAQKDNLSFKFCSVAAAGTQHFHSMGEDLCGFVL